MNFECNFPSRSNVFEAIVYESLILKKSRFVMDTLHLHKIFTFHLGIKVEEEALDGQQIQLQ